MVVLGGMGVKYSSIKAHGTFTAFPGSLFLNVVTLPTDCVAIRETLKGWTMGPTAVNGQMGNL